MRLFPIKNPKSVHLAAKSISQETALFHDHLNELISNPDPRESPENYICLSRGALTSWRNQLDKVLQYVAQDLTP